MSSLHTTVVVAVLACAISLVGVSAGSASALGDGTQAWSVVCAPASSTYACKLYAGFVKGSQAQATVAGTVNVTGWEQLELWTSDDKQAINAFAAGYLEGAITQPLVWAFRNNFLDFAFDNVSASIQEATKSFMTDNAEWVRQQAKSNPDDDYWARIGWSYTRLDGMLAGYNSKAPASEKLSPLDMYLINSQGDIGDIITAVTPAHARADPLAMPLDELLGYVMKHSHCSVLFKFSPDMQQLFAGHNMWWSYYAMLRVFKIYHYGDYTVMFSSYPGLLSSTDDIYQLSTGMVVIETTNDVFNMSLYAAVTPESVLSWARVVVCNRLTSTGKDWTALFAQHNSGTYNNMWMVLDTKLFTPGTPPQPGTLFILEQLPGYTQAGDVTRTLTYGYWPSYNRAYFPEVAKLAGYPAVISRHGNYFTYAGNPRANIFRRSQSNVTDMESFKWLMRYNEWQTDPFSGGSAANQIAARYDLVTDAVPKWQDTRSAGGAIDAKLTSATDVAAMRMHIISGPTHESQPVFKWDATWSGVPHRLQPAVFDFEFIEVQPQAKPPLSA